MNSSGAKKRGGDFDLARLMWGIQGSKDIIGRLVPAIGYYYYYDFFRSSY
jgi:hypothetical protein